MRLASNGAHEYLKFGYLNVKSQVSDPKSFHVPGTCFSVCPTVPLDLSKKKVTEITIALIFC